MKLVSANVDQMQVFRIMNKDGMKVNADVNAKNWLTKEYVIKKLNLNPSNRECECDKSCDVGEFLNYKNCKCRKKLFDKLVEECNENIDEKELHQNKMIYNSNLNDYEKICSSCTIYIVSFVIFFTMSVSISSVFIYFHWYLKRKSIETAIY